LLRYRRGQNRLLRKMRKMPAPHGSASLVFVLRVNCL